MFGTPSSILKRLALAGCGLLSLGIAGCSGGGDTGGGLGVTPRGARLLSMHQGRLVDVYGLRSIGDSQVVDLYRTDMLVGLDIQDERESTSTKRDEDILYDFISANPDNLQPRLLITREIGSKEFLSAVDALDDNLRLVSPDRFGKNTANAPYSIVPRNAALRLTFSEPLGIDDGFFYLKDENGKVTGTLNTQAVQLLKIVGDPTDTNPTGDFVVIPTRIAVRDNILIIDPVLLGTEGLSFGSRNSASGMPESPNQKGANIRVAIATAGPLRIRGIAADKVETLNGLNNDGFTSVIRDFRSGNSDDNSSDLSRGFIRDPEPPRLIGEMLTYMEVVETDSPVTKLVTIFKDGIAHEIDRGDQLRIIDPTTGEQIASREVLTDPQDDFGRPEVPRVRTFIRPLIRTETIKDPNGLERSAAIDVFEDLDPADPFNAMSAAERTQLWQQNPAAYANRRVDLDGRYHGLPPFPPSANRDREDWNRRYAPKVILVAEFTKRRPAPPNAPEPFYGDDPRNFISFNPRPLPNSQDVVIGNENVSPFAGAIVRFSKPVDMSSLIALDTVFFGTRNVLDTEQIAQFVVDRKIEPATFNADKFRTPHLIHSRIFDEDGSQTAIRVQPTLGFYLDRAMRDAAKANDPYLYYLHLVSGNAGITDLAGNPLDFQDTGSVNQELNDFLVLPFSLDTRESANGEPRFEDNLVAYVVRRFAAQDEDENPSYYRTDEVTPPGQPTPSEAFPNNDLFGPVSYLPSGELISRPSTRLSKVVDNVNQISAPPQSSNLRWCPLTGPSGFNSVAQIAFQTAATVFGQPIQNPLNPFGCRLQTVWREIDMSLSRTDPLDFNLDVEQMYWAPFTQNAIIFDEFDQVSLFLGHSEFRPEPCIASGSAFPSMPNSGLIVTFESNYAHNLTPEGKIDRKPPPHPAYVDKILSISAKDAILEPNGINRFLPLPKFDDASKNSNLKNPLFIWRDEQEIVQGGSAGVAATAMSPFPYILSPFLGGRGRRVVTVTTNPPPPAPPQKYPEFQSGGWHNGMNRLLTTGTATDRFTGGCVGTIALPLLADFWTYPDSPQKPVNDPFLASGINGWQISLPVTSSARPNFRAFSSGRGGTSPNPIDPTSPRWKTASGGYTPTGGGTAGTDNSVYWIMADFMKRTAVVTSGFVELVNPHRMPTNLPKADTRLGPFVVPAGLLPTFAYDFEPPLTTLPAGTAVIPEFRGASELSPPSSIWPVIANAPPLPPNPNNEDVFPLDPLKAGDAHIRHYDDRPIPGTTNRSWWVYLYNNKLTEYTADPNTLMNSAFTNQFSGPFEAFEPKEVKYFNWRFVMRNNVEADPPIAPKIESFSVAYRFTQQ